MNAGPAGLPMKSGRNLRAPSPAAPATARAAFPELYLVMCDAACTESAIRSTTCQDVDTDVDALVDLRVVLGHSGLARLRIAAAFLLAWTWIEPIPPGIRPLVVAAFVFSFALCTPVVRMRSDMSYSVYLLHGPLLQTLILTGLAVPQSPHAYKPGCPRSTCAGAPPTPTDCRRGQRQNWQLPCLSAPAHLYFNAGRSGDPDGECAPAPIGSRICGASVLDVMGGECQAQSGSECLTCRSEPVPGRG